MVEIKLSTLTTQVNNGLNLDELASCYSLSRNQVASLLKEANLKLSRKGYRLVKDTMEIPEMNTVTENATEDSCLKPIEERSYVLVEDSNLFN